MKRKLFLWLIFIGTYSFSQPSKFAWDWETIKSNSKISQKEVQWLQDSLSKSELARVIDLVSDLSRPAASQLLVSHFYLDGSFKNQTISPYLDSLSVRPPDGEAGIIRVAYLVSGLRKKLIESQKANEYYVAQFGGNILELPDYDKKDINTNIRLSFDYEPAEVLLDILSKPDIGYQEIIEKLNLHQFDKLIDHRNQSFYGTPINKEKLATCLEIASSTKPINELYMYANPYGLLNLTDVKSNLTQYKNQLKDLYSNEQSIFNYINASIAPFLLKNTAFERKVSFFYMEGADGWASGDVTALDLNYFKDDYQKLLPLLVHETYHSGQNAVAVANTIQRKDNIQLFVDILNYVFNEGTATYVAPPSIKTDSERVLAIKEGIRLLEGVYESTIIKFDEHSAMQLQNSGIAGAGPFYWLGAEMSRVIVSEQGSKALATTIPKGGIAFFKAYFSAVQISKSEQNMFNSDFREYILKFL